MKRTILFFTLTILLLSINIYAGSSPNIDSGGGGMGQGTSTNSWSPGRDGVRITIVRDSNQEVVSAPIDFANGSTDDIQVHFGNLSKIAYRNGTLLLPVYNGYHSKKPDLPMPTIVKSSGGNNIAAIKRYFCDKSTIELIANKLNFSYNILINGEYKILLEPIVYIKYESVMYALTATEAALFDQMTGGDLRSKFVDLSHKNLPLAMFLEFDELGLPAWNGSKTNRATNEDIITYLGAGIIRFNELEPNPTDKANVIYRCNTEVITSVTISSDMERTPENPASVDFYINGTVYRHKDIYIPEGNSQLAWVKWKTPTTPGMITILVSSDCTVNTSEIVAQIVDMNQNIPPDPQANDRNNGFRIPSPPSKANVTTRTWGEWDCWWHEHWVWIPVWVKEDGHMVDKGYWEDHGWYEFKWIPYSATLSAAMAIKPDEKSPTATATRMKSGYSFNMNVSAEMRSNAPSRHFTGAQNVVSYFPEFNYQTYWRLLERINFGFPTTFEFQRNKYSTYYRPVHFSPVWFPDGPYTAYAEILDAWTPAGMLQINMTGSLTIYDNLFSDWHVKAIR